MHPVFKPFFATLVLIKMYNRKILKPTKAHKDVISMIKANNQSIVKIRKMAQQFLLMSLWAVTTTTIFFLKNQQPTNAEKG